MYPLPPICYPVLPIRSGILGRQIPGTYWFATGVSDIELSYLPIVKDRFFPRKGWLGNFSLFITRFPRWNRCCHLIFCEQTWFIAQAWKGSQTLSSAGTLFLLLVSLWYSVSRCDRQSYALWSRKSDVSPWVRKRAEKRILFFLYESVNPSVESIPSLKEVKDEFFPRPLEPAAMRRKYFLLHRPSVIHPLSHPSCNRFENWRFWRWLGVLPIFYDSLKPSRQNGALKNKKKFNVTHIS